MIGRSLFIVVILVVFTNLWEALRDQGTLGAMGAVELIWYLALTEWVALGVPQAWREVNEDVRTGDIAYLLSRPMSYLGYRYSEALGRFVVTWLSVGAVAMCAAWLLAGALPEDPRGLIWAVPLSFLSGMVLLAFYMWIGVLAFWMQNALPAYFIFQKFNFVLGGLMLPLTIYPQWLRSLADCTPFSAMLYGVGRSAFDPSGAAAVDTALRLVLSLAFAAALSSLTFARARRARCS